MAESLYALPLADARALRRLLGTGTDADGRARPATPRVPTNRMYVAKTTTTITARSGTTPGAGTVAIYYAAAAGLVAYKDAAAADVTVAVKNVFGSSIASGTWVIIGEDLAGTFWIVSEDC